MSPGEWIAFEHISCKNNFQMSRYPSPIFNGELKKVAHHQEKHYNVFASPNKNISKISVTSLIMCLLICIAIVSTIIWYSVKEVKNEARILPQNKKGVSIMENLNSEIHAEKIFNYDFDEKNELENANIEKKPNILLLQEKEVLNHKNIIETKEQNNVSNNLKNINLEENSEVLDENEYEKLNLVNILDTLSSIALGSKKTVKSDFPKLNKSNETKVSNEHVFSHSDRNNNSKQESLKINNSLENDNSKVNSLQRSNSSVLFNTLRNQSEHIGNSALNYLNGIISVGDLINNTTFNKLQISTNSSKKLIDRKLSNTTNNVLNKTNNAIKIDVKFTGMEMSENKNETNEKLNNTNTFIFQKIMKILKNSFVKYEENYYDQDYFYSENDAQQFYYDYERVTWSNYLLEKIQELYDWIVSDVEMDNGTISKGKDYAPLPQACQTQFAPTTMNKFILQQVANTFHDEFFITSVAILRALNYSILEGDASILLIKLKEVLFIQNNTDFDSQWNKKMLTNTSSVLSFGLLALDVLLLRNIQLIAWDSQEVANREVMKDPNIFTFNALFMDPSKVQQMQGVFKEISNGVLEEQNFIRKSFYANTYGEDLTSSFYKNTNFGEELMKFVLSTIRAITNLGYAFKNARKQLVVNNSPMRNAYPNLMRNYDNKQSNNFNYDNRMPSEIDCLWTLYCKNLETATNLEGVYGFLAKINGIGLRLVLGKLSLEQAFEAFVTDTLIGLNQFQCNKLFTKCDEKLAPKMILREIITRASQH